MAWFSTAWLLSLALIGPAAPRLWASDLSQANQTGKPAVSLSANMSEHVQSAQPVRQSSVRLQCTFAIKPDQLVIAGGVSAQSVAPSQAAQQIDQRMDKIQRYLLTQKARLVPLDRLRAARNVRPDTASARAGDTLPFMQLQRFEALLPVDVPVDAVLEQLFKLGMDRYGEAVSLDGYQSEQFSSMTLYRFNNAGQQLASQLKACRDRQISSHCGARAECSAQDSSYGQFHGRYLNLRGWQELNLTVQNGKFNARELRRIQSTNAEPLTIDYDETLLILGN